MASLADVGDSVELTVPVKGTDIDIDISGTYNMTIELQREAGSPGSGAWEFIKSYSTANATVAEKQRTKYDDEKLRLIVTSDTSGTATATLTDDHNRTVKDQKDLAGNSLHVIKENGHVINGAIERTNAVVEVTADTTLTAEEHAGKIIVFNDADGATLTLPAATGTGNEYIFVVGVTVTSNNDVVQVANATDEFIGNLFQIDTDTSDAVAAYPALDGDGFDTVTLNGSTKGGLMGDRFVVEDVASGKFAINGTVLCTGSPASPFSADVS